MNKIVVNHETGGKCSRGIDHGKLLNSGMFADFTIKADGQLFKCHKAILAARSPVFQRMLNIDMRESATNELTLTDVSPDNVKDMLSFIYNDNVEHYGEKARDLLPVAEKYDLADLKTECSAALIKQIKLETAVELALLADLYNVENLRQAGYLVLFI